MANPELLLRFTASRLRVNEFWRDAGRSRDKLWDASRYEMEDTDGNARDPLLNRDIQTIHFYSNAIHPCLL